MSIGYPVQVTPIRNAPIPELIINKYLLREVFIKSALVNNQRDKNINIIEIAS